MKRALLFVHYHKYNGISEHILYLLKSVRHVYSYIVFISNSSIDVERQSKLDGLYDKLVFLKNKDSDFESWKDVIFQEGIENLSGYDNLTLMNDTCFGPFFELEICYACMESKNIDFWGMSAGRSKGLKRKKTLYDSSLEYIDGYFICFNKNIVQHSVFKKFWETAIDKADIEKNVKKYEVKLTHELSKEGFRYDTVLNINNVDYKNKTINEIWYDPYLAVKSGVPFIRIESFYCFKHPQYVLHLIEEYTAYPVQVIKKYFSELFTPNESLFMDSRIILAGNGEFNEQIPLNAAIHLHVYYFDIFKQYISCLDKLSVKYDLFITTDTHSKKEKIENYLQSEEHRTLNNIKDIIVLKNKGRNVLPWLNIAEILNVYDIVGHFHTKKTATSLEWISAAWQDEIFNLLLCPIKTIIRAFYEDKNIGVIIPEIPYYFSIVYHRDFMEDMSMKRALNNLWKKMNCKKQIDFESFNMVIMPYGTMFWYRPAALKPLFDLQLSDKDIPEEPIPTDGTILHYIERLIVYLAWNEGYDYRIMSLPVPQLNNFFNMASLMMDIEAVKKSKVYRCGKLFAFIPQKLKKILLKFRKI
jgi:rhamnosyltransferase